MRPSGKVAWALPPAPAPLPVPRLPSDFAASGSEFPASKFFRSFDIFKNCVLLCFIVFLCGLRPFLIGARLPDPSRERPARQERRSPGATASPSPSAQPGPHREPARRVARAIPHTRCRCSPHPRQYNGSPHHVRCRRDISHHLRCHGDILNKLGHSPQGHRPILKPRSGHR
jgi:hypothetical protein